MRVPRDTHKADRVGSVRLARHLSNIISPPTMFAATGFALGVYERPFWPGVGWAVLYGLFSVLSPMFVVLFLLRTGRIGELHMSATNERHIPYLSGLISGGAAYALLALMDGPQLLRCLAIMNLITLGALGLINTRWLISIHATAAAATWLIASLVFGWGVGLVLLPVAVFICYIRLFLQRHTPAQVLAGVALGLSVVLILRALGCFVA
ncbi:phosphatase PAP2 family protein [Promineifilum sp.]|uniref:phosphatase PAP2 family protein n=1 Tax=Promineifilum sp. TaxID=2664178 RepID=UPI0035AE4BFA